jgi:hypothetical protein
VVYSLVTFCLSFALIIFTGLRAYKSFLLLVVYCIFIFFALAFNSQNQDYAAYVGFFDEPRGYAEIGYVYLVESLKYIGFASHFSVLLTLSILIVLTFLNLYKYTSYLPVVLIFYLMFLFPIDVVQIRNTFVVFITLNAILFLYEKRYVLFILLAFVAITFHYMAIVYLAMVFASFFLKGKNPYFLILLSLVISTFLVKFALSSESFVQEFRTLHNYVSEGKLSSVLIWGSNVILFVFLVRIFVFKNLMGVDSVCSRFHFSHFIYTIILASLIFLPGLYYLFEFNRLYRFVLLLILIFMGATFRYISIKNRIFLYVYLIFSFGFFGFYYSSELDFDWILFGA